MPDTIQQDDPLMKQAESLVWAANVNAAGALVPVLDKFYFLKSHFSSPAAIKRWDLVVTIAGVFMAATRLENLSLGISREQKLMAKVSECLAQWNPHPTIDCPEFQ